MLLSPYRYSACCIWSSLQITRHLAMIEAISSAAKGSAHQRTPEKHVKQKPFEEDGRLVSLMGMIS